MQRDRTKNPEISLTLFVDDGHESKMAREALEAIQEPCNFYHVQALHVAPGDEIEAPMLYAPEGVFRGWRQVQTFLKIPPNMRHRILAMKP